MNVSQRFDVLAGALLGADEVDGRTRTGLVHAVGAELRQGDASHAWLALAVLNAEWPVRDEVVQLRRRLRLEDPSEVVRELLAQARRRLVAGLARPSRSVRIIQGVVVDVHHTAHTRLATGIQRVARKTAEQWSRTHDVAMAGWTKDDMALRVLTSEERENAISGSKPDAPKPRREEVLVPWRAHYVLPELAIEDPRTARIAAMAEFSGNQTSLIGFDCVPITTAETVGAGMGAAFSRNLVAAAHFDRIAAISVAAATEYRGWRSMLGAAGLAGPEIEDVFLPIEAGDVTDAEMVAAREELLTGDLPLLLCVGSHEPRKNHLAVLNAAEILWRKGREFSLVFVGGNAWGSEGFQHRLGVLKRRGRPVRGITAITDALLWSAYRLAQATVFPSWNEGFGLPVAESIASGTPVVTSNFGSMHEIGSLGGARFVSPRDEEELAAVLDEVLFDEAENRRLREAAAAAPRTSWGDYANALWDYFGGADR